MKELTNKQEEYLYDEYEEMKDCQVCGRKFNITELDLVDGSWLCVGCEQADNTYSTNVEASKEAKDSLPSPLNSTKKILELYDEAIKLHGERENLYKELGKAVVKLHDDGEYDEIGVSIEDCQLLVKKITDKIIVVDNKIKEIVV
jgi:hypothetical protein